MFATSSELAVEARATLDHLVSIVDQLADSGQVNEVRSALLIAEGATRALAVASTRAIAVGRREGVFFAAGYRSDAVALSDLLKWDLGEAKRRIAVADAVNPHVGVTGEILPPKLEATAAVFAEGGLSVRHVEVLNAALESGSAKRIPAGDWTVAEHHLAELAPQYTPQQLAVRARDLIDALDQDGPEPDDREINRNELRITRHRDGGGSITARYDDAERFGLIAGVIDAKSAPHGQGDERTGAQRQADALAEVCGFVHTHDHEPVKTGGRRTQMTVTIGLDDLEARARRAYLDTGDRLSPAALRMLACDADVVPVVLNGEGQPVDVGRRKRVVTEPLRRAVAARDRGCAHPGCDRPPAWSEVHHIVEWAEDGPTSIENCVMLCRFHHRAIHHDGWRVEIGQLGKPVFRPPAWVDPERLPLAA